MTTKQRKINELVKLARHYAMLAENNRRMLGNGYQPYDIIGAMRDFHNRCAYYASQATALGYVF